MPSMLRREAHRFVPANHGSKQLQMPIGRVLSLRTAAHQVTNGIEGVERGVSYVPNVQ